MRVNVLAVQRDGREDLRRVILRDLVNQLLSLGAEGVLPGGYIESLLRVFKQLTHILPSGEKVGKFSMYSLP